MRDLRITYPSGSASLTTIQSLIIDQCSAVLNPLLYHDLPDCWLVGVTDVVNSRKAVRAGRLTDVSFAGASVIAALANAIGTFDFPFAFAGDGAAFAVPPEYRAEVELILQQVAAFTEYELALKLRTGLVNVREIRLNGKNVSIARHPVAAGASCYMFSGGGITWMENAIKSGCYAIDTAYGISKPNFQGLSCVHKVFPNRNGQILSLLIERSANTSWADYAGLVRRIIGALVSNNSPADRAGRASGLATEDAGNAILRSTVLSYSDFCKCDDRLRLTSDCSDGQISDVEKMLWEFARAFQVRFGLHVQSHAIITCMVPSGLMPDTNLYFLDGYGGGYTEAAAMQSANFG